MDDTSFPHDASHDEMAPSSESGNKALVRSRVQLLRAKLLDSSRRNPLIHVPFRQNSSSLIRVVDELPDVLAEQLSSQKSMRLVSLPPIDQPLPDEQTDEFLDALEIARETDEQYVADSEALEADDPDYAQKELDLERALKDRVRADLGMEERQTKDNLSLSAHAKAHNISPEYELPQPQDAHDDGRHDDADIQTLLLPERLDRVGRSLHDRGHAFERETGVNVLHAAFGILEWKEPGSTKSPAGSPLLLLEVKMSRKKAPEGAEYHISGEDELAVNTTLAQTLSADFGLELPEYKGGSIEAYFDKVRDLAPAGWHWKLRREAIVGVFPSSRIAMYRDLDPDTSVVTESPIIETLLATAGGEGGGYAEVYDTDAPEIEKLVPRLVMDADASQFSSLVDVANGKNIAIEGPPGSGKSQTIVNLIASAMAAGKKVLFVAEKLTALDVVRNRLEAANLGEFILPLQAGRGSRDAVFKSLQDRLSIERPVGGASANHRSRHDALTRRRSEMQSHLEMLGAKLGSTGLTVHEALGQAIATADHLEDLPREIRRLAVAGVEQMDADVRGEIASDAGMMVDRMKNADKIAPFWHEVGKAPVRTDAAEDIARDLDTLARAIEKLLADAEESPLRPFLPEEALRAEEAAVMNALRAVAGNPTCDPGLAGAFLDPGVRQAAQDLCEARAEAEAARGKLAEALSSPDTEEIDRLLQDCRDMASRLGGTLDPAALRLETSRLEEHCASLREQHALASALPTRWAETAAQDGTTLAELRLDIEQLLRTPSTILARRSPDSARSIPGTARSAVETKEALELEFKTIKKSLPKAGSHESEQLRAAASTIEAAGPFRFLSGSFKQAWSLYRDTLGGNPKEARPQIASSLRSYASWIDARDSFAGDKQLARELGATFEGMESDPAELEALASYHETIVRITKGDERLRYALETGSLDALHAFNADVMMPSRTLSEITKIIREVEEQIDQVRLDLEKASAFCLSFRACEQVSTETIDGAIAARGALAEAIERAASSKARELLEDIEDTRTIRIAILVAGYLAELPDPQVGLALLKAEGTQAKAEQLMEMAETMFRERDRLSDDALWISDDLGLDHAEEADGEASLLALSRQVSDIKVATARPDGLIDRARLLRAIAALEMRGFEALTSWVQTAEGQAFRDKLPQVIEAVLARNLTDHVQDIYGRTLDLHDGADLDRLRREIAQIDAELTGLARAAIREDLISSSAPPTGNGSGKVGTYTEMCLIHHEINKTRNRVGVRDLTSRAGRALIDLKPCWMMSPLAVAQYLHGKVTFDLVVIDEASQMTPENALGAIMRAKQVVIVGDTKQLPPTNFFSKVLDNSDEDEDLRTDQESILEIANATFTPVRQLRWHYRSRHPDLIAISNKMVYDDQLTIFPAARDKDASLGLELVEVEGTYQKGRNIAEARAIVAGAVEHMRVHPDRSLGLATMNQDQAHLILSEFERERARHPHVEAYIERWLEREEGLEEFFIKNLETIQGDERDVIMISTLYGPDPDSGKVAQRFGPVNSPKGYRRLNVLFSRAKEKVVTYSSMKPTDIKTDGKPKGVSMLRAWLEFSKSGQIGQVDTGYGTTESPFEDFVVAQIEAAGFEAVPQVGASGYRIDIGVRHKSWPYGFILAVECDGAPYHSSRSSRDRDRLRQEVLEGLGWHFHRIWSTDWFRDRRTQITKLHAALGAALLRAKKDEEERQQRRAAAAEQARLEIQAAVERSEREAAEAALANQESEPPAQQTMMLEANPGASDPDTSDAQHA